MHNKRQTNTLTRSRSWRISTNTSQPIVVHVRIASTPTMHHPGRPRAVLKYNVRPLRAKACGMWTSAHTDSQTENGMFASVDAAWKCPMIWPIRHEHRPCRMCAWHTTMPPTCWQHVACCGACCELNTSCVNAYANIHMRVVCAFAYVGMPIVFCELNSRFVVQQTIHRCTYSTFERSTQTKAAILFIMQIDYRH